MRRAGSLGLTVLAVSAFLAFGAGSASAAETEDFVTNYASFGPDGTESTDFQRISSVAVDQQTGIVYVLDGEAGTLSKFEADGTPLAFSGTAPYIEGGKITGLSPNADRSKAQVAVDSASAVIYVTEEHSIKAFHSDGEPAEFTAGPGVGTSEIGGFDEAAGVAVDSSGSVYVSD